MFECATASGTAVLLARIVDCAGASIRPRMLAAIEYSLFGLSGGRAIPMENQLAVPLDVERVLFDTLQTDRAWSLDVCGYNFRHEFDFTPRRRNSHTGGRHVLVYEFTPVDGPKTTIRFQLKGGLT